MENPFLPPPSVWWLLAVLGGPRLVAASLRLCLCLHVVFLSPVVSKSPSPYKEDISHRIFGPTLIKYDLMHVKLITSAKTLFPTKGTFTGLRV